MSAQSVTCPECGAGIKFPSRSDIPSKVRCAKCKVVFVTDDQVDDDLDPVRKPSSRIGLPKRGSKKSKIKPTTGSRISWIIGGIGIAVVCICGLAAVVMRGVQNNRKSPDQLASTSTLPSAATPQSITNPVPDSVPHKQPGNSATNQSLAMTSAPVGVSTSAKLTQPEFTPEIKQLIARNFSFPPMAFGAKPLENVEVKDLQGIDHIVFADEDFDWLYEHFPNIEKLVLLRSKITDAGAVKIAHFKNLQELDLSFTAISDPTIEAGTSLKGMRKLQLVATKITDKSLKLIADHFPELEWMSLSGTSTSDVGLRALTASPLEKLKFMFMDKTHISKGALEAFDKAHPKCNLSGINR